MFWLKSNPATRQPGTFKIILGLLWLCVLNRKAEMPYLKDFNAALKLAEQQGRIVILYTGRAERCLNNDPKAQFFQEIFKDHPKLAARAEQFVVCEHFGYAPSNDAQGNLTPGFFADTLK